MSHKSVKSQLTKLCRSQTGIAHLGLILVVVSVAGIIGLGAYSVLNKPNTNSAQFTPLDAVLVKEKLNDIGVDLRSTALKEGDLKAYQAKVESLSDQELKGLINSEGRIDQTQFNKIFGGLLKDDNTAKNRVTSSLSKPNYYFPGLKNKAASNTKQVSNNKDEQLQAGFNQRPKNTPKSTVNLQDQLDRSRVTEDTDKPTSNSDLADEPVNQDDSCNTSYRKSGSNGKCIEDCESPYYLYTIPGDKYGQCVKQNECPNGIAKNISQRQCARGDTQFSNDAKQCENELGRSYDTGKKQCLRSCNGKKGMFLQDLNGNGWDKCVNSVAGCKLGAGWTSENPGYKTVGGTHRCEREGSTPKSTNKEVSCKEFLNYVNLTYYQCPNAIGVCPDNKLARSKQMVKGVIKQGGITYTTKKVCKYAYDQKQKTGPYTLAGCGGYLKRVWKDDKCLKDCLPKHEYWRTISGGEYKGWAQCRATTDSVSSVSRSFCSSLGRNWERDSKGNGRCTTCKNSSYELSGHDKKISDKWQICKKKNDKKNDGGANQPAAKCNEAKNRDYPKLGLYCSGLSEKECKTLSGFGSKYKWQKAYKYISASGHGEPNVRTNTYRWVCNVVNK